MPVSEAMKLHLQGTTSLAVFLRIVARDSSEIAVWNGTRNKIVDGITYFAYPLSPSRLQATNGLKPDNLEVVGIYSGLFNAATLRAKKWLGARVEYRVMNYRDFTMGYAERRVGFIGDVEIGKYSAKPELKSLSSRLAQPHGRTFQADCDVVELGDARCQFNLNGNTADGYRAKTTAVIAAPILNRQQFSITFTQTIKPADAGIVIAPNALFERGRIRFLSGANAGVSGQIINNAGNALTLYLPVFYNVQAGDQIELTVGCNRKISTCRDRFANAVNNQSFYSLPGKSRILKLPE